MGGEGLRGQEGLVVRLPELSEEAVDQRPEVAMAERMRENGSGVRVPLR